MPRSVNTLLREYQDYVMAYRLRQALGGRLAPRGPLLGLGGYASKRVERQKLARAFVNKEIPLAGLREIDRLTDETAYGFWHNPSEVAEFLRTAMRQGGHAALGDPKAFGELFTEQERQRLNGEAPRVCEHYLACLALAVPGLDPAALDRLYRRVESFDMPLFVDELPQSNTTR